MALQTHIAEEVKYHFTHYRTNEFFLTLSLISLFGFGFLAFLFAYVDPFNMVFGAAAFGGFILFAVLEVVGSLIGYLYQNGLIDGLYGLASSALMFTAALIAAAVGFAYFFLGGVFVFGGLMLGASAFLPMALRPLVMVGYIVGAVMWAINGLSYWESTDEPRIPPLGMIDWIRGAIADT